jgi:hypothetical protein
VRAIVAEQFDGGVTLAHDGWHIELGD